MNKPIKNILCYSHYDFDNKMRANNWTDRLPQYISAISICSPNEGDLAEHWFKNDYNTFNDDVEIRNTRVFNLDFDDCNPYWFKNQESKCYDDALELYLNKEIKRSNAYFNQLNVLVDDYYMCHVLDYEESFKLVDWIDWRIKHDNTIYIHCAVGVSRSQGVVRYIVDTYGDEFDIKLNPNNPNNTYNPHVVMMLKRAYRELFMNVDDNEVINKYFETEPMNFNNIEI